MHPTIIAAYKKAQANIDALLKPQDDGQLRKELEKLSKKELVEIAFKALSPKPGKIQIDALAYAVLEDPDCAWLTWEAIAEIIKDNLKDSKTTGGCVKWYSSKGLEKGRNVVPRKTAKEIAALALGKQ